VLDVGIVDHTLAAAADDTWLHRRLCRVARSCPVVDVLSDEIDRLRARGFNVLCHDLSETPLDETFELVVCGELIEHLDAPGPLLRNVKRMLRPGGLCVLTTPNPWYLNPIVKNCLGATVFEENADHVAWFDPWTIAALAERCGLRLARFAGIKANAKTATARLAMAVLSTLTHCGVRPELMAKSILYELVSEPDENTR